MEETKIALVVFDMAGTTVYDGDAVHRCLGAALRLGNVQATRDEINAVMGIAKPLAIRTILERHTPPNVPDNPATVAEVSRLHVAFLDEIKAYYASGPDVREMEGASETFHTLQNAGIKVALDTGFSRDIVDVILQRLGWDTGDLLDATVASDEVPNGRPHPDMIYHAMKLVGMGTGAEDCKRVIKVGDTPSDLQEGTAAGCGLVVGVTNGSHTRDELARHPHTHLLASISELPSLLF